MSHAPASLTDLETLLFPVAHPLALARDESLPQTERTEQLLLADSLSSEAVDRAVDEAVRGLRLPHWWRAGPLRAQSSRQWERPGSRAPSGSPPPPRTPRVALYPGAAQEREGPSGEERAAGRLHAREQLPNERQVRELSGHPEVARGQYQEPLALERALCAGDPVRTSSVSSTLGRMGNLELSAGRFEQARA